MSWKVLDRMTPAFDANAEPLITPEVREKIESYFPRYETKRAALLPALHLVQNTYGHVSYQAMSEIAEVLEIHPSDVLDTITFYTHFWTHKKGRKVITVCRSLSCEVCGGAALLKEVKKQLNVGEHETTPDGEYSLVTEECLAVCDHGPCMLINEKMHKRVRVEDVEKILSDPNNDKIDYERSDLFDPPAMKPAEVYAAAGLQAHKKDSSNSAVSEKPQGE